VARNSTGSKTRVVKLVDVAVSLGSAGRRASFLSWRSALKPETASLQRRANGAEARFGAAAERHGIDEVNFSFEGHNDARRRGLRVLTAKS